MYVSVVVLCTCHSFSHPIFLHKSIGNLTYSPSKSSKEVSCLGLSISGKIIWYFQELLKKSLPHTVHVSAIVLLEVAGRSGCAATTARTRPTRRTRVWGHQLHQWSAGWWDWYHRDGSGWGLCYFLFQTQGGPVMDFRLHYFSCSWTVDRDSFFRDGLHKASGMCFCLLT